MIVPEEYRAMHLGRVRAGDRLHLAGQRWLGSGRRLAQEWRRVALEVFLTPIQEADENASGVLGLFRVPARD